MCFAFSGSFTVLALLPMAAIDEELYIVNLQVLIQRVISAHQSLPSFLSLA
jgi:hypothetical protein